MNERKTPLVVVQQGAPVLSHSYGYLVLGNDQAVTFYVDLDSKYCEVLATGGDVFPEVYIAANERSMHLSEAHDKDSCTWVQFTEFPGWNVHCVEISKYTAAVALTNPAAETRP